MKVEMFAGYIGQNSQIKGAAQNPIQGQGMR